MCGEYDGESWLKAGVSKMALVNHRDASLWLNNRHDHVTIVAMQTGAYGAVKRPRINASRASPT